MEFGQIEIYAGILLLVVGFFFAIRTLVLWYWKIDKGIALLEEQNRLLRKLVGEEESSEEQAETKEE